MMKKKRKTTRAVEIEFGNRTKIDLEDAAERELIN